MYRLLYIILMVYVVGVFFFKQKTTYEMRISDWSSDVCSSDRARTSRRRRWRNQGWRGRPSLNESSAWTDGGKLIEDGHFAARSAISPYPVEDGARASRQS